MFFNNNFRNLHILEFEKFFSIRRTKFHSKIIVFLTKKLKLFNVKFLWKDGAWCYNDNFFASKMTTRKLRARSQSKQAEVFDLMQNWCIFFIQSLWRVFVLLSFLQKKRTIDYCNAVTYYYCQSGSTRIITENQRS